MFRCRRCLFGDPETASVIRWCVPPRRFVLVCWIYGTVSCILGRVPRLPLVGDAADQQVQ